MEPTAEAPRAVASPDAEFHAQIAQAAADLREHGWAALEGVLPQEVCKQYVTSVWDWLEGLGTSIRRDEPTTWDATRWPPSFRGIINTLEASHQDFVWRVRTHPRVIEAFAQLWGTNELLGSFDSINISKPEASPQDAPSWLHTDQAPSREGAVCIQGLLNLVDVSATTTGTLVVKPDSHLAHQRFFQEACVLSKEAMAATGDFYQFTAPELPFWEQFTSMALSGKAGSLFLWDSRTAHQNCLPEVRTNFRHVVYVCYQDRGLATPHDLALKREAWDDFLVTTHWPAMNIKFFPKEGSDYYKPAAAPDAAGGAVGADLTPADPAAPAFKITRTRDKVENDVMLRMAGKQAYPAGEVWRREPLLDVGHLYPATAAV